MKEGKPSHTAGLMAVWRAIESRKPEHERVCYDPLAKYFLYTWVRIITKSPTLAKMLVWFLGGRKYPGIPVLTMDYIAVRTRYIDDYLKECIGNGIRQLVILGAGYDSRAYRIEGLKGKVKVFEVDHPATQMRKIERLKKLLGALADHVVYVPIDFSKEKLDGRLLESGYDRNSKTLFIWEGVTLYISAEAVDETLAFVVNNSGEGSSIIFDYIYQSVVDGTCELEGARSGREYVARVGEPYTFGIGEGAIDEFLSKRGYWQINNATAEFLESTYFKGVNQGRKVLPFQPIVHATVKPKGDLEGYHQS